ncbi:putative F-box protein At3g21120 [Chenopodium quinoa]|nr:putative F-box protein At3g21120 [Chenopodium quinoa]
MRFRCVCKSWCSLIDSSDFIVTHLHIYNKKRKSLIAKKETEFTLYSIDAFKKIDKVFSTQKDHCNSYNNCFGLILLQETEDEFVFYNPCIRKSLVIPPCPFISMGYTILYYPGFASSTNDHKIVAFGCRWNSEVSIAVYSLNDRLWRIKDGLFDEAHIRRYGCTYYSKSATHWLGFDQDYSKPPVSRIHLVSFDFDSEEFSITDFPDALKQKDSLKFLFTLGESIAAFSVCSMRICIWVLVKDGGDRSWRLWYTGDTNLEADQFLTRSFFMEIFNAEKNTFLVLKKGKVYSYNFRTHQIQHLENYTDHNSKSSEVYVENLVLHKRSQGKIWTDEFRTVQDCQF